MHAPEKSGSSSGCQNPRKGDFSTPKPPVDDTDHWREHVEDVAHLDADQISQEVDRFTASLSAAGDKSDPPDVPDVVYAFSKIVEARIASHYSSKTEDDSFILHAVRRLTALTAALGHFPASPNVTTCLNRTSTVIQRAMVFLENCFRDVLEDSRISKHEESDPEFPGYSPEAVAAMTRIAKAMVSAGYETECSQVYIIARRHAFYEEMKNLDINAIGMDDWQKLNPETLEKEITKWVKAVKRFAAVLFPGEKRLCDVIFAENPSVSAALFGKVAHDVLIQLLNFADGIVLAKRSAEKLFKYLDMYEALNALAPAITQLCLEDASGEILSEVLATSDRIAEAAVYIFCDLENSVRNDAAKTPVPGGAVHPLTRYVTDYLNYACKYKDTLEQIFEKTKILPSRTDQQPNPNDNHELSPFAGEILTILDLLDANIELKSKLYRDPSLRFIFLMNNGRYVLQNIKRSNEILELVGHTWYRMRSTIVRQYHKNYQRETWGRVLHCLSPDGMQLQGNGKVSKPAVKERFKSFNSMFDEIRKAQSMWVVSDEQLRSELRVSVSGLVVPAYRSFLGRFSGYLDPGKQSEKYIKYQPEDIEGFIEGLFEGSNLSSLSRKR
ncbi:hypothetical protein NMG60_11024665 [Bertholletia excelsa]